MGYIIYAIALIVGGCFSLIIACLIMANKEKHDRQELIERLRKEIYEEINNSNKE